MTTPAEGAVTTEQNAQFSAEEQAAIAKGQQGFSEPTPAPAAGTPAQRPDDVPEKFWDAEKGTINTAALLKSYTELEKSRQAPAEQQQQAPEQKPAAPADGKVKVEEQKADEPKSDSPLAFAMEAARNEWAEKQEVSEEAIKALEDAGIPREIFSLYLEGVKAQQAATLNALYSYAGGEEEFAKMTEWAGRNITQAEADAYNAALDDPNLRENAVRGLYARYTASQPNEGRLVTPAGTPAAAGDVFNSRDEFLNAQRDPRYATDAAYRQSVVEKLARSRAAGSLDRIVDSGRFPRTIHST